MNNGNLQLPLARTSSDGPATADELSRTKRELLQAEVRLAKAPFEGAAEFRTDGHAAGGAAAAFKEPEWESVPHANLSVEENVADGQRQHLGNPEAQEHLRGDEGAVARIHATDVPDKTSFFTRGERTGAGEAG